MSGRKANHMYDAIVVGARCAGAPTAMLLARRGHKVLLVDRSKFPSDVLHSTLLIHQPGCQLLRDWGVLERVAATGCPPLKTWHVGMGPLVFRGVPSPSEGGQIESYAPRRYLLDQILVDAAASAGAEFRDEVTVEEFVMDGDRVTGLRLRTKGGAAVTETARIVIGADGVHSALAARVRAPEYEVREARVSACYTYFSGTPVIEGADVEMYIGVHRAAFCWPTNDGQVITGINWMVHELDELKRDPEGSFYSTMETLAPDLYRRLRGGKREADYVTGRLPKGFFRKPYGPGWALVGDSGASYEFTTAQGITNALRQAQLAADAIGAGLSGRRPMDESLADFERRRNEIEQPYYDFTFHNATLQPPDPNALPVFAAVSNSPAATSAFFGVFAQTVTPAEFFAPAHIESIMGGKAAS